MCAAHGHATWRRPEGSPEVRPVPEDHPVPREPSYCEEHVRESTPTSEAGSVVTDDDALSGDPATSYLPHVQLPKLSLKMFNVDFTTWITFWESTVHNNPLDIDRFKYLTSLL